LSKDLPGKVDGKLLSLNSRGFLLNPRVLVYSSNLSNPIEFVWICMLGMAYGPSNAPVFHLLCYPGLWNRLRLWKSHV